MEPNLEFNAQSLCTFRERLRSTLRTSRKTTQSAQAFSNDLKSTVDEMEELIKSVEGHKSYNIIGVPLKTMTEGLRLVIAQVESLSKGFSDIYDPLMNYSLIDFQSLMDCKKSFSKASPSSKLEMISQMEQSVAFCNLKRETKFPRIVSPFVDTISESCSKASSKFSSAKQLFSELALKNVGKEDVEIKSGFLTIHSTISNSTMFCLLTGSKFEKYSFDKDMENCHSEGFWDIALISAKPSEKNPKMFELNSATSKSKPTKFQADSVEECKAWIAAIQQAVSISLSGVSVPSSQSSFQDQVIKFLQSLPGNDKCADCKDSAPDWACINHGTLICQECSGVHRSLGVSISKVRSIILDVKIWHPELLMYMKSRGNTKSNQIFGNVPEITPQSPRPEREAFIKKKYVQKAWVKPEGNINELNERLAKSCLQPNIDEVAKMIAMGADVNHYTPEKKKPIHLAVLSGELPLLECLFLNGADPNAIDSRGWNPLHYAGYFNRPRCAKRLLFYGVPPKTSDFNGITPYAAAVYNRATDSASVLHGDKKIAEFTFSDVEQNLVHEIDSKVVLLTSILPPDTKVISKIIAPSIPYGVDTYSDSPSSSPNMNGDREEYKKDCKAFSDTVSRNITALWSSAKNVAQITAPGSRKQVYKESKLPRWSISAATAAKVKVPIPAWKPRRRRTSSHVDVSTGLSIVAAVTRPRCNTHSEHTSPAAAISPFSLSPSVSPLPPQSGGSFGSNALNNRRASGNESLTSSSPSLQIGRINSESPHSQQMPVGEILSKISSTDTSPAPSIQRVPGRSDSVAYKTPSVSGSISFATTAGGINPKLTHVSPVLGGFTTNPSVDPISLDGPNKTQLPPSRPKSYFVPVASTNDHHLPPQSQTDAISSSATSSTRMAPSTFKSPLVTASTPGTPGTAVTPNTPQAHGSIQQQQQQQQASPRPFLTGPPSRLSMIIPSTTSPSGLDEATESKLKTIQEWGLKTSESLLSHDFEQLKAKSKSCTSIEEVAPIADRMKQLKTALQDVEKMIPAPPSQQTPPSFSDPIIRARYTLANTIIEISRVVRECKNLLERIPVSQAETLKVIAKALRDVVVVIQSKPL
eukprot:TRINITY_DN3020_c2_g1_i1.p1 TRINITY_DN3020_c2_g1~~TRINITY_DN3020_c2_g1_i1.p1  ORF type:complete len:1105 (+),score=293.79 TRINITY_DN3020_c2_g1_i1:29-3316(+)